MVLLVRPFTSSMCTVTPHVCMMELRMSKLLHLAGFLQITLLLNTIAVHCSDYNATMGVGTSMSVSYSIAAQPTVLLQSPSSGYMVSLDCRNATITIANRMAIQNSPVLVWLPTYFNGSYTGPITENTTCTLKLEEDGDLQLSLHLEDQTSSTLIWSSGTKGQDVQMLEIQDSGNLVLLNSTNGTVWQSFDYPTNILLWDQKFKKGMSLVAADATGYHSAGTYMMSLEDGDLRLYAVLNIDGNKTLYWSLSNSVGSNHIDLGKVEYAALYQGGIGLFAEDDSVVLSSTSQSSHSSYSNLYGFLSADANFQVYLLYEGQFWGSNYAGLESNCQNPNACGSYGICSSNSSQSNVVNCTCPPSFSHINAFDPSKGCASAQKSSLCGDATELMLMAGQHYSYFSIGFSSPTNMSLDHCKQSCLQNCSCLAVFVDSSSSNSCFLILNDVLTIMQTSSTTQTLFLKVYANTTHPISPSVYVPPLRTSHGISKGVLIAAVVLGILLGISVIALGIWWGRRKARTQHYEKVLGLLPGLPPRYSYKDLHIATNGFSQQIGKGGFGSVFAGTLGENTRVAVKQLEGGEQGEKQFVAEVAAIGNIDHVNLVQLLGFCMEGEQHRLLVYEFMEGGSLEKQFTKENEPVLGWKLRYCIAVDVAKGLAYLHEGTRRKIIHCDVKSANILLDAKMRARISDLGLCKIMYQDLQSHIVATCMRGTRGYLAPEWLLNMPVSEKSDVYSYGVVLLELVSGRRVMDMDAGSESITSWACKMQKTMYMTHLLDVRLQHAASCDDVMPEESEVHRLVQVALLCTQEVAASRPAMSYVVKILEGEGDLYFPNKSSAPFIDDADVASSK